MLVCLAGSTYLQIAVNEKLHSLIRANHDLLAADAELKSADAELRSADAELKMKSEELQKLSGVLEGVHAKLISKVRGLAAENARLRLLLMNGCCRYAN